MDAITLTIDGKEVKTTKGKSVLHAALDAGIYIPHLCDHPDLRPAGACRLCICEIEGMPGLPATCTTAAADGMVVKTKSKQINKLRTLAMELTLTCHPLECTDCPKYLNCELQSLKQYLGITETLRVKRRMLPFPVNNDNPLFTHDFGRCILCGRCVRACYEVRQVGVLSFIGRGRDTRIGTAFDKLLVDSDCVFCGACIEVCPTGALRDKEGIITEKRGKRASLMPCRYSCPAEIDVPRYIRYTKQKNYSAALAVIREKAPFPAVLGYVCVHPCESVCRRGQVNEAIAIKDLKRYAAQKGGDDWKKYSKKADPTGRKVAVIGAGPAGLTAAYYLSKLGHSVTVFEALKETGGMLRYGIPEYRLPRKILDGELNKINGAGFEIKTGFKIESLDELEKQGYNATLVAIGAHKGQKLPIPGSDLQGILLGTDFLRDVSTGNKVAMGKRVLVIGGGNVAFDCARAARRLGASEVIMACLECSDEMLASKEEIEQGKEEGIVIHNSRNFKRINGENGSVTGMVCEEVKEFKFDETGKLCIDCVPDSEHELKAGTIIFAIGQRPDLPPEFGLDTGRGNTVIVDTETMATSRQGIFAAGDAVTGTTSVIDGIASGRKAAAGIDKFLGGTGAIDEVLVPVEAADPVIGRKDNFASMMRCGTSLAPMDERLSTFNEMDHGFDEKRALEESIRCLQCDLRLNITRSRFWADYLSE